MKFTVRFTRDVQNFIDIEVDAKNIKEAKDKAEQKYDVLAEADEIDWDQIESNAGLAELNSVFDADWNQLE